MNATSPPPENPRQWANVALDVDLEQIMAALEAGFPVRLIGTFKDLVTCRVEDPVGDALGRAEGQAFDYLPVTYGDKIVGLLNRRTVSSAENAGELVSDVLDPLDESNIIAADAGILLFLLKAKVSPCRLILTGDRVTGLVSKSDLQKLPVRALLFHMVTHLELAMAAWIRRHLSDEPEWLALLSEKRRQCIGVRYGRLIESNLAIDRLTATTFADKRSVLLKCGELSTSRNEAEKEFKRIEKLRNSLAHSGDYALTEEAADQMIGTVASAQSWIESIPNLPMRSRT